MKCILHIGTEKTGTTTLQKWLYENRPALLESGIGLLDCLGAPNNRRLAAYFTPGFEDDYFVARNITTPEERAAHFGDFHADFEREISALRASASTIVISCEQLSSRLVDIAQVDDLMQLLARHCDDVAVCCYFRPQDELRRSHYSTVVRNFYTESIESYHRDIPEDDSYYNYYLMISRWAQVFGRRRIFARQYGREVMIDGDIRHDFAQTMLGSEVASRLRYDQADANVRLSTLQARAMRAVNEVVDRRKHAPLHANLARVIGNCERMKDLPSPRDAHGEALMHLFAADNERLFQEFLPHHQSGFAMADQCDTGDSQVFLELGQVEELLAELVSHFTALALRLSKRAISDDEVFKLRDAALTYEAGVPLDRSTAIAVMKIARRLRPSAEGIVGKVEAWSSNP